MTQAMTQHPTLDHLSGYILSPQDQEFRELRRHLVTCQQCRQRIDHLSALTSQLRDEVPHYRTAKIDPGTVEDSSVALLSGEAITETQRNTLTQSPGDLKAALHSLTHSAAMRRQLEKSSFGVAPADTSVRQTPTTNKKGLSHLWKQLFNWNNPVWISVPVTAVLVFAVTVALMPVSRQNSAGPVITAYQDDPVVTFRAAGSQRPGIGFFSNVPSTSKPFNSVAVTMDSDHHLTLRWPAIDKAADYKVSIAEIKGDSARQLFEKASARPEIRFAAFQPQHGRRYTWTITGTTQDGRQFQAQGGFVIQ